MKALRFLLFPFSFIYFLITSVRNYFYDSGIFKSYSFDVPIIAVGNLSVGGTGKTPQIEYLIRLLQNEFSIAVLSRGYKRKSVGFVLANETSSAIDLGDEPFQMFQKFPKVTFAVDTNRKNGIEKLLQLSNKPEIILLDDAMQHRKVKASYYILLTAYSDLFVNDFLLPTGNLREARNGARRANVVVVTKCPDNLSAQKKLEISKKIGKHTLHNEVSIYFSTIKYSDKLYNHKSEILLQNFANKEIFVIAGIAKPQPFIQKIKEISAKTTISVFADHHDFTPKEISDFNELLQTKTGITTEKDFVRLQEKITNSNLFYLPIKSDFGDSENNFKEQILNFMNKFNH